MATLDGAPWFVAADVCRVLGMAKVDRALAKLDPDERSSATIPTAGGPQRMSTLSEPGLYRLIMRSDKPIARPFQDWVTCEVLPAIRKTGGYVLAGADPATVEVGATEMMPLPATFTEALRQHAATLIRLAEEQGASRRRDWEAHARTMAERLGRVSNSLTPPHQPASRDGRYEP